MKDISCIKGNYNFTLEYHDCRTLLYQDLSDWMDFGHYIVPDNYKVKVGIIGREDVEIAVNVSSPTKITSSVLEYGSTDHNLVIPEGIYVFETESCGVSYKRYRAISCILRCKLDTMIVTSDLQYDYSYITKLELFLRSMEVLAEMGSYKEAQKLFKYLEEELSCIQCNC